MENVWAVSEGCGRREGICVNGLGSVGAYYPSNILTIESSILTRVSIF